MRKDKEPSELMIKIRDIVEMILGALFIFSGISLFIEIFLQDIEYRSSDIPLAFSCFCAGIYFTINSDIKRMLRKIEKSQGHD